MSQRSLRAEGRGGRSQPGWVDATSATQTWVIALAWLGIAAYVVMFYAAPIAGARDAAGNVLRRIHVLAALVIPDELVNTWLAGASWQSLGERAAILLTAGAIFGVALAAGWMALRSARLDGLLTRLEAFVFAAGVGLNLVSLATLALGLCGVMRPDVYAAIGTAVLIAAGAMAWRGRGESQAAQRRVETKNSPAEPGAAQYTSALLWLAAPFVVVIFLGAMLPPVDFDVREYHLQAPKEFFEQGRVTFLPHNVYANMPLGTEMLSLLGMIAARDGWTGALVGKVLIASFAPLAALLLVAAGRRVATRDAGVVAALVYISIPWIALVSMQGLVEGAFAFYWLAALVAVLLWQQRHGADARAHRLLWLAGFLAGGAVSTKYPAVVFCVVPLAGWIAYASLRQGFTPPGIARLRPLLAFLAFVVLGCGLWLAKNAAFTGNPVYPLAYELFGGVTRTLENNAQWRAVHDPPNFDPADFARRASEVVLSSPWLSPLLMPLAALGVLTWRSRLAWWLAAYCGYVFVVWWCFTHRIDRFWIPMLPIVALLAGLGATWTTARGWRLPFIAFLVAMLAANFVTITSGVLGDNHYLESLAVLRRDPLRVDPWHLYLNDHAAEVSGVLLVGDAQPFDLEVPSIYSTVFDASALEEIARDRSPEAVRRALAQRHISHIYVNWREVQRYRSPGNYGITPFIEPAVFAPLVEAGVLARLPLIEGNPNELYRVLPASPKRAADGDRQ
ncbi:MAG: ArnT family glycosyltransferase [Pirellulales bacterium]